MNYYKLCKALRNAEEKIPDNDMRYFKSQIEARKHKITPPAFFYEKYECYDENYDPRDFTIHDDIINFVDYRREHSYPWKSQSRERILGMYKSGKNWDQPIFNDDLINEIKRNNKKVVYNIRK